MRKPIDGLVLLTTEALELDPQAKAMYLFHNKVGDKFKAIIWDGDGLILLYKGWAALPILPARRGSGGLGDQVTLVKYFSESAI